MSTANVNNRRHHPLVQYFADIWAGIKTTYLGMKLTLSYLFSKPVTMRYPEERPVIPPGHRGVHEYVEGKCTLCGLCTRVCPVDCIHIEMLGRGRNALALGFSVDYARCLFCNLCAEACPTDAIKLGEKYDLACGSREACLLHFARPKTDEEIAEFKAMLEQKAASAAQGEAPKTP